MASGIQRAIKNYLNTVIIHAPKPGPVKKSPRSFKKIAVLEGKNVISFDQTGKPFGGRKKK